MLQMMIFVTAKSVSHTGQIDLFLFDVVGDLSFGDLIVKADLLNRLFDSGVAVAGEKKVFPSIFTEA